MLPMREQTGSILPANDEMIEYSLFRLGDYFIYCYGCGLSYLI